MECLPVKSRALNRNSSEAASERVDTSNSAKPRINSVASGSGTKKVGTSGTTRVLRGAGSSRSSCSFPSTRNNPGDLKQKVRAATARRHSVDANITAIPSVTHTPKSLPETGRRKPGTVSSALQASKVKVAAGKASDMSCKNLSSPLSNGGPRERRKSIPSVSSPCPASSSAISRRSKLVHYSPPNRRSREHDRKKEEIISRDTGCSISFPVDAEAGDVGKHLPPGYMLKETSIDRPFEGDPCHCQFIFLEDDTCSFDQTLDLKYQWFVGENVHESFAAVPAATEKVFWPRREDVSKIFKVECTPVLRGLHYPAIVAISSPVSPALFPSIDFISITGDYIEGEMLKGSYVYIGGHEGRSFCSWYLHEAETEAGILIPEVSGQLQYCITKDAVDKLISFKCIPVRDDGIVGEPKSYFGLTRVRPGCPRILSLEIVGVGVEGTTLFAERTYWGGEEGGSCYRWVRISIDGTESEIVGATSSSYKLSFNDIGFLVSVYCEPVRNDWAHGSAIISESIGPVLPGHPTCHHLELIGQMVEGQTLNFSALYSGGEKGICLQEWLRIKSNGTSEKLSTLESWDIVHEDVGQCIKVVYMPVRKDGLKGSSISVISDVIVAGVPRIISLEVEGGGFHTNLYAVRGAYKGGKEGKSKIQWLRSMAGIPDLIVIPGEGSKMYEANVDDVGCKLVSIYTPIREDGVEGESVSATSEPIAVEPNVFKEVKHKTIDGYAKFEVLRSNDPTTKKYLRGGLERRILEINKKRIKVVKPGSKTSFRTVEICSSYAPPFHVVASRTDQHMLKIVVDAESEVDLVAQTQFSRDVIVLVIRDFAQRFSSTSLDSLLKIDS